LKFLKINQPLIRGGGLGRGGKNGVFGGFGGGGGLGGSGGVFWGVGKFLKKLGLKQKDLSKEKTLVDLLSEQSPITRR
jgi:hypothetical protein